MDGISFGGIYDAFDSFERQMEEGRADIFNEDDPPSVAVAASATQSFGSIIGCDLTRRDLEKWQTFWTYFLRQWMPPLEVEYLGE